MIELIVSCSPVDMNKLESSCRSLGVACEVFRVSSLPKDEGTAMDKLFSFPGTLMKIRAVGFGKIEQVLAGAGLR